MIKKRSFLALAILLMLPIPLLAGTYRPKDGFLSFILLLGFLMVLLGVIHLADLIRSTLRRFSEEINFEDLF